MLFKKKMTICRRRVWGWMQYIMVKGGGNIL